MAEQDKERAERVGDPRVSAAYRVLGAEEPPRALDEAILAAARRPARQRWSQRWAVPLSLAAVVVLSVVVTLRVQHERPEVVGAEAPAAAPPAARQEEQPLKLKAEDRLKAVAKPAAKLEARRAEPKPFADAASERARQSVAAAVPAPAPPAALGGLASRGDAGRGEDLRDGDSALRREEERISRDAEAAARAPQVGAALAKRSAPETARIAAATPEQEFERIAQLRREGRHDEADKAFLEFRRRYPHFRITEEMLRRVERQP